MSQVFSRFVQRLDPAIDGDVQARTFGLEAIDQVVMQRRYFTVLTRAEALQPGLAGVHDDARASRGGHGIDKPYQGVPFGLIVDGDAMLDGNRDIDSVAHGRNAARHEVRAMRQAPKRPDCTRSDGQPTLRLISS